MKALTLLPKKIKKMYLIHREKDCIAVHNPAYININFDDNFKIYKSACTWVIQNDKVIVALWLKVKIMHVTVLNNQYSI